MHTQHPRFFIGERNNHILLIFCSSYFQCCQHYLENCHTVQCSFEVSLLFQIGRSQDYFTCNLEDFFQSCQHCLLLIFIILVPLHS